MTGTKRLGYLKLVLVFQRVWGRQDKIYKIARQII